MTKPSKSAAALFIELSATRQKLDAAIAAYARLRANYIFLKNSLDRIQEASMPISECFGSTAAKPCAPCKGRKTTKSKSNPCGCK